MSDGGSFLRKRNHHPPVAVLWKPVLPLGPVIVATAGNLCGLPRRRRMVAGDGITGLVRLFPLPKADLRSPAAPRAQAEWLLAPIGADLLGSVRGRHHRRNQNEGG